MSRDSYEMSGNRLSRGSSLFGTDPQVQLRTALRNNDLVAFKKLLSYGAVDPEFCYEYPDYKTCLDIACSEANKEEFIKLLLEYKIDINRVNETHSAAPLHFAIQNGNLEAIKILLENSNVDVNLQSKGNSAILLALKQIEDLDDDREREIRKYEEIIEMLLKAGCDVNAPDMKGITPVYSASRQGMEDVLKLILDYSQYPIDLDSYKDRRNKTARTILKDSFPHLLERFEKRKPVDETVDANRLFSYLSRHEEEHFIRDFIRLVKINEHKNVLSASNGMFTLLQMATEKGLEKVVQILLANGADPNLTAPGNKTRPIAIACQNGYNNMLKLFADNDNTHFDSVNGESLVEIVAKGTRKQKDDAKRNYKECLEILLKHPRVNINLNHGDVKDNTALHYAARNGDQEAVLTLLRSGACIGLRNKFNEPPLADIQPETLETFLDECLTTNGERPSDDDYEINMNYKFLVYPNNSLENELSKQPLINNSNNNNDKKTFDTILAPETDALLYMATNEDLKPLLKHPVITSFLYLKWQRISCLFYANLTFYSLFWLSLILYILLDYGVEKEKPKKVVVLNTITYIGSLLGFLTLILRELFQLLVSPKRYLRSIENWVEIALIVVTGWILFYDSASEPTKQQLSAIAILLSSTELVLLIGLFPSLSTNIVMLRTVSWNFFKFLLWYFILIIAFALSFYTLFRKVTVDESQVAPDPNKNDEEEDDFFLDPGTSLFKTVVMLTGEFDASSIKFNTFPGTSHVIFIVFVFMIPIVLFNLLNGLAVSDTQAIKANAELVGHVARVKLISYLESIFLSNLRTKNTSTQNGFISTIIYYIRRAKIISILPLARRICLFPDYLPMQMIIVKPNRDNRIEIPQSGSTNKFSEDGESLENGVCVLRECGVYRLEGRIVKQAKEILSKRNRENEFTKLDKRVSEFSVKLDSLEKTINRFLDSVEMQRRF